MVARVKRKHHPKRMEKREKGKTGDSKLASSPVPPGVDRHPKKEVLEPKRGLLFYQEAWPRGSVRTCHVTCGEMRRPTQCRVLGSLHVHADLLPLLPPILPGGFPPGPVSQAGH